MGFIILISVELCEVIVGVEVLAELSDLNRVTFRENEKRLFYNFPCN